MKAQTNKIVHIGLTAVVGFVFIGSGLSKFFGGQETIQMAQLIGLNQDLFMSLGVVEVISVLLFIYPRTGVIGTFLLAAYMGGAIAVHLTHGQSLLVPVLLEALVWIVAWVRFPELRTQLLRTNAS